MSVGRTIKLYLVDGVPGGLVTAEILNWTGHVITGPRSRLAELLVRPEAQQRTGVYFLVGPEEVLPQLYIGESDEIDQRLKTHGKPQANGGKDFWERVCVVTSKDGNLTKGHVKYLESSFLRLAQKAARAQLVNDKVPEYRNLPEADIADMEFFITQVQTLLPVLGMDFLRPTPKPQLAAGTEAGSKASPVFHGDVKKHGIKAKAQEIDGEFVVMEGSLTRKQWEGAASGYRALFEQLLTAGVISSTADGKYNVFTRNYAFGSASAAGAVVTGRSCNGLEHWVDPQTGLTYGNWRRSDIEDKPSVNDQS